MADKKSLNERIEETRKRIAQYEHQVKHLLQKQKEQERKARTHRLIERGALLESMIEGADSMTSEELRTILVSALGSDAAIHALLSIQERRNAACSEGAEITREEGA